MMGRKVRRVPLDFDWPQGQVWSGFVNTLEQGRKCPFCQGSGYNAATEAIANGWFGPSGWRDNLTQDEVDALVSAERLWDHTRKFELGKGWVPRDPPVHPTAAEINAWSRSALFGHDAINRSICVEVRARRLGVWGKCEHCGGSGEVWLTPAIKAAAETWEPTDPPVGAGWQMWETTTEGSPISPVFTTIEELTLWLDKEASPASRVVARQS